MVIFNGDTFREGADFKRPVSDGQLLNYEDTLLYVGGLEGYQGTMGLDLLLIETSFSYVIFSGSVASESIFILDGVRTIVGPVRNLTFPSPNIPSLFQDNWFQEPRSMINPRHEMSELKLF